MKKQILLNIENDLAKMLDKEANKLHISRTALIKLIISQWLNK